MHPSHPRAFRRLRSVAVSAAFVTSLAWAAPALAQQAPAAPSTTTPSSSSGASGSTQANGQNASSTQAKPNASLGFTGDAGFVFFTVKAELAADFEAFFAKVKDALEQGTTPEYKQMAAGWRLFKVTDAPQGGQVLYASLIDPAVKGVDYNPVKIVADVFPAEVEALSAKLHAALVSVNRLNMQPALKMGGGQ
jgi:hypothetical protein